MGFSSSAGIVGLFWFWLLLFTHTGISGFPTVNLALPTTCLKKGKHPTHTTGCEGPGLAPRAGA